MVHPDFMDPDWCGLRWTEWIALDDPEVRVTSLPDEPGVYRIRPVGKPCLAYIGQTGKSLRWRLRTLRRNVLLPEMPFSDPHVAAHVLWAYRNAEGLRFECSVSPTSMPDQCREGLECFLIWKYRNAAGTSTYANHGRMHHSFSKPGRKETGERGTPLPPGQRNPAWGPCYPPLKPIGKPEDDDWMGLRWSAIREASQSAGMGAPPSPGVYRIMDSETGEVVYIGQSSELDRRLRKHARSRWACPISFSWAVLGSIDSHCLLEAETDLIGRFYELNSRPPAYQFMGRTHGTEP